MKRYGLHGKLTAKEGSIQELTDIMLKASQMVSKVKGCQLYAISKDETDPDSVWITEIWDSREDHQNSLQLEEVRSLIGEAFPLIAGQPTKGQELLVLGGFGVK